MMADIIKGAVEIMRGYYEIRANGSVVIESGRKPFDPSRAKYYLENIDRCLPQLKIALEQFDKEYGAA